MYFRRDNRLRRNSFHRLTRLFVVSSSTLFIRIALTFTWEETHALPPSVDVRFQSIRVNLREICANA